MIWLAWHCAHHWGRWAVMLRATFGVFMIAAAAFSSRSWLPGAAYDRTEDFLHSFAATAMGFAFAPGVAARAMYRHGQRRWWLLFDAGAIAASVIVPLTMSGWPQFAGLYQRGMFAVAYLWYGAEAVRCLRPGMR